MKATSRTSSIQRWYNLLKLNSISYTDNISGREIVVKGPSGERIQINHNSQDHFTIRIPGSADNGMRFVFKCDIEVMKDAKLITLDNILAIRYS